MWQILVFLLPVLSGLRFFLTLDHSVQGHKLNVFLPPQSTIKITSRDASGFMKLYEDG